MPKSRYLAPLFWLGATLGFFGTLVALGHFRVNIWLAWLLAWLVGAFVGLRFVGLFLRRFPDARYLTPAKIDGMGYVWGWINVLAPYLIVGVLGAPMIFVLEAMRK